METEAEVNTVPLVVGDDAGEGRQFGPYKTERVLGEGGMGVVYLARQEHPIRRQVALKVVKVGMSTREVMARFDSERRALAVMDHPNIARVFDAGSSDDGLPYFVMEYVSGVAITEYCDQHRLSNRARMELFIPVCLAVQHAHQKGVIHRDIKPSNVLVSVQDGRPLPKVIDFGVAKATNQNVTERTFFSEHGILIGTPEYMSPEQAGGEDVDATTDIYSLGTLLYELLVGVLPFDPKDLRRAGYDQIRRIIREEETLGPAARLRSLGPETVDIAARRSTDPQTLERQVRGDVEWITAKAMEKERTRRYASASELAADIGRYLHDEPVQASPPGRIYRASKFVRKHRGAVIGTVLGLLCSVVSFASIVTVGVFNETNRQFESALERVATLNVFVLNRVREFANRPHSEPLRDAWADPDFQITLKEAVASSRDVLDIQVIDARTNEILADTLSTHRGITASPLPDFEELVRSRSSSWLKLSRILGATPAVGVTKPAVSHDLYQLERELGHAGEVLLRVRIIIDGTLLHGIMLLMLLPMLAALLALVICALCLTVVLSIALRWCRR